MRLDHQLKTCRAIHTYICGRFYEKRQITINYNITYVRINLFHSSTVISHIHDMSLIGSIGKAIRLYFMKSKANTFMLFLINNETRKLFGNYIAL